MKRGRVEGGGESLLSLATSSLLDTLCIPEAYYLNPGVKAFLFSLRATLLSLPSQTIASVDHSVSFPSLPLRGYSQDARALEFTPPTRVDVVGGFILQTLVNPALTIDLCVEVPPACLSPRDVKNHVWSDKRAMYLGVLARHLQGSALVSWVACEAPRGDPGRPCLLLRPSLEALAELLTLEDWGGASPKQAKALAKAAFGTARVRLIPVLPPVGLPFPPSTLRPSWNNVRPHVLIPSSGAAGGAGGAGGSGSGSGGGGAIAHSSGSGSSSGAAAGAGAAGAGGGEGSPTPYYNACVASDLGMRWFSAAAHEALHTTCPVAQSVVVALKAWARRRGWHRRGEEGVSTTLLTALVVYLVQVKRLIPTMTTPQALGTTFSFLCGSGGGGGGSGAKVPQWVKAPIVLFPVSSSSSSTPQKGDFDATRAFRPPTSELLEEFKGVSPTGIVVLCPSGVVNFASHLPLSALWELITHARVASHALEGAENGGLEAFEGLWSSVLTPSLTYDRICTLPLPPCPVQLLPDFPSTASSAAASTAAAASAPPISPTLSNALCNHANWGRVVVEATRELLVKAMSDRVVCEPTVLLVYTPSPTPSSSSSSSSPQQQQLWPLPEPFSWALDQCAPTPNCAWVCLNVAAYDGAPMFTTTHSSSRGLSTSTSTSTTTSSGTSRAPELSITTTSSSSSSRPSHRIVEKGPSPESATASKDWLELWGPNVSSLRRFVDGAIQHAVVWDSVALGGRGHARDAIVPLIAAHVLERHLGVKLPCGILHVGDVVSVQGGAEVEGEGEGEGEGGLGEGGGRGSLTTLQHSPNSSPAAAAAAVFYADIGNFCPSLSLEKVLDGGGHIPTSARVKFTTFNKGSGGGGSGSGSGSGSSGGVSFIRTAPSPLTGMQASMDGGVGGRLPPPLPLLLSLSPSPTLNHHHHLGAVSTTVTPLLTPSSPAFPTLSAAVKADPLAKGPHVAFSTAVVALDAAIAALKSVGGSVPLRVLGVTPTSPALRYTSAFPPAPHPLAAGGGGGAGGGKASGGGGGEEGDASGGGGDGANSLLASLPTGPTLLTIAKTAAAAATTAVAAGTTTTTTSRTPPMEPVACQTITPLRAIITLERSSKWPSDPTALAALKTAFYLKLQYALNRGDHSGGAGAGVGGGTLHGKKKPLLTAMARPSCLDVILGGYLFRFTIALEWELRVLAGVAGRGPLLRGKKGKGAFRQGGDEEGDWDEEEEEEEEEEKGEEEKDGYSGGGGGKGGTLSVSATSQHKLESIPKKAARKAVELATGIKVGKNRMSLDEMAAASARVFGYGRSVSWGVRHRAGEVLDALYLCQVARPTHASFIHALALTYPAFAPSLRLAVAWLRGVGLGGVEEEDGVGELEGLEGGGGAAHTATTSAAAAAGSGAGGSSSSSSSSSGSGSGRGAFTSSPIPFEAIELLMAHVFTSPSPHASPPATPTLGLLRWLHLIATKDWAREPLVVPYPPHTASSTTTTTTTSPATLDASSSPAHLPTPARLALLEHFRRVRRGESGKANVSSSSSSSSQITGPPMFIVLAPAPTVTNAMAGAGEEGGDEEGGEGEGGGSSGAGSGAGSAITATIASRAAIRVPWFKPLWTRSDPSLPVLSALVDLARSGYTQLLQGLTTLAHAPCTAAVPPAPAAGRKGGKKEGGVGGRGAPHRAFIGEPKGTQLWGGVVPPHPEGTSTTATASSIPPLPALLYPGDDFAPRYHAWLSIAPHLIPRCAMDGRYMGPVATPSYSSLALANLPSLLASRLTLGGGEEGEEERRGGGAGSGGGGGGGGVKSAGSKSLRPALVLAVPTVSAAAAAAAAAAGGDTTQVIPGAPKPPTWSPPIACPGTLPWLGGAQGSSSSASSLGVSGGSHFTLSLHTNLLPASRKALLPGFDPLEHYLFTLRTAPGVGGGTLLFPRVRFSGGGVGGGGFSAGVGVVARRVGGEQPVLLAPTLALAGELGAGYLDRGGIEEDE